MNQTELINLVNSIDGELMYTYSCFEYQLNSMIDVEIENSE